MLARYLMLLLEKLKIYNCCCLRIMMFSVISIILYSCNNNYHRNFNERGGNCDSLGSIIQAQESTIIYQTAELESKDSLISVLEKLAFRGVNKNYKIKDKIIFYEPIGLGISLKHQRPVVSSNNFLCVPGAFSTVKGSIDGLFIEKGELISYSPKKMLNGTCIIKHDAISILPSAQVDKSAIDNVKKMKYSLFQQLLLIHKSKIVKCNIWKYKQYYRRALVVNEDKFFIAESEVPMSIIYFQRKLLDLGAVDAIYLDMGSWSEGWVKDSNNKIEIIGNDRSNTNKQSNWLVFNNN